MHALIVSSLMIIRSTPEEVMMKINIHAASNPCRSINRRLNPFGFFRELLSNHWSRLELFPPELPISNSFLASAMTSMQAALITCSSNEDVSEESRSRSTVDQIDIGVIPSDVATIEPVEGVTVAMEATGVGCEAVLLVVVQKNERCSSSLWISFPTPPAPEWYVELPLQVGSFLARRPFCGKDDDDGRSNNTDEDVFWGFSRDSHE